MKIVSNEKMIKRNATIGRYTTLASLAILGVGLFISFQPQYVQYSFIALLFGFVLSQVGIYFGSRWGRSPRPDETLSAALKGLNDQYTLYHYVAPVPHLLVGPAGIWVLQPYYQKGVITYDEAKGRWKQKGGNLYMKVFAQEGLGRPDLEVRSNEETIANYLHKKLGDIDIPGIKSALVFTNDKVELDAQNAPVPTVTDGKLKDLIRRKAKEEPASLEQIRLVEKTLPTAA